jgi:hypothetical protein
MKGLLIILGAVLISLSSCSQHYVCAAYAGSVIKHHSTKHHHHNRPHSR